MTAAIPQDIIIAARRTYDALGRGSISDSERIARAIMAERERCAQIAENNNSWPQEGAEIAAEIRNPTGE